MLALILAMRIFFDFERTLNPQQAQYMFEGESGIVLNEIKKFIEQRLEVLKDEIEAIEGGYIEMITLDKFRLICGALPKNLCEKIDSCFSLPDFTYLSQKISQSLSD